ncbi:protein kinase [Legionella lytica]|uniref:non-specific serine/threonine protein kinase n=1 Tax=Legionella lytica TaxID=96232 RepID=A0ABY4Y9X1_9GAMM|nr:protein kinase [Legionella lytica]USQ14427.1 protein kinase [Legionella lytica]
MPFIDLSSLTRLQPTPFLLDKKVAKFLHECKKNKLLPPLSMPIKIAKDDFVFSHQMVKSAENQWHILESEPVGEGQFGVSYKSKFKITITKVKHDYQAEVTATNDIAKIQRVGTRQISHQELVRSTVYEAHLQRQQHVRVSSVIDTKQEVITVVEDCGPSFDKLLPFKPGDVLFPFLKRVEVALHIANEMFILQQREMVHCDIKPSNICYKEIPDDPRRGIPPGQFQIIFIDFGLARKQAYQSESVVGSIGYMAPEVLTGAEYSYASDMYALAGVFAELFGCTNILRNKEVYSLAPLLVNAPYCLDGIFTDYDVSDVDPFLLEDIKTLINQMQAKKPELRPNISVVSKFFTSLRARMDAYNKFCADWFLLTEEFKRLESHYLNWHLLKERHHLESNMPNRLNVSWPASNLFNRAMVRSKEEIYQLLSTLTKKPKSHYVLAKQLVNENRLVDFEGEDCPYPLLDKAIATLNAENLKLDRAINCFNHHAQILGDENKFRGSNSSGISYIFKILNSDKSPIEKLCELKALGHQKTESSWANYYSRSRFFGKGRHENMEELYQKLNRLTLVQDLRQNAYIEERQLEELNQFISENRFTHS